MGQALPKADTSPPPPDEENENLPSLTMVSVVCRQVPRVGSEPRLLRRIGVFLDFSPRYELEWACFKSLALAQRVFARTQWDQHAAVEGLHNAVYDAKLDIIQWLCTLGEEVAQIPTRDLINKESNSYGALLMGTAAWRGHLRVMQWLYKNGAVVNARDRYNRTALHWASCGADLHIMEWLVSKGSFDVNGTDSQGRTALHEAAEVGRVHVVRWLLGRGAEIDKQDDEGLSALAVGAKAGKLQVVECLAELGAALVSQARDGRTTLHLAAQEGNPRVVQWLLTRGVQIDRKDKDGRTALQLAACCADLDTVECLIEAGAHVHERDLNGQTVLHEAAGSPTGNLDLVKALVNCGLQPFDGDKWGQSALFYATVRRHFDIALLFLADGVAKEKPPLSADLCSLLLAAAKSNQLDVIQYLCEVREMDICQANPQGRTALLEAAAGGATAVVRFLLGLGARCSQPDTFGTTSVMEACAHGHVDAVRCLLEAGGSTSDIDFAGRTALTRAADGGHEDIVAILLEKGGDVDVDFPDKRGWTALHCSAAADRLAVIKLLCEQSANVDAVTISGKTALDLATEREHDSPGVCVYLTSKTAREIAPEQDSKINMAKYSEYLLDPVDVTFTPTLLQETFDGFWLGSPVTVKKCWYKNNFEELYRWAKVNHPHVVKLYGFCDTDTSFFVYERASQGSILEYCDKMGTSITPTTIWDKLYEAALGLQYLHDRNIIHGYIYHGSIAIAANGVAKLQDFGGIKHNPAVTAPEVIFGCSTSFESDIFSFGITIIQAVKQQEDVWGLFEDAIRESILVGKLPLQPEAMSDAQFELVKRMCRFDPRHRLSCSDVVRELEAFTTKHLQSESDEFSVSSWASIGGIRVDEKSNSTISTILEEIGSLCSLTSTSDNMNRDAFSRLTDVFKQLQIRSDAPTRTLFGRYSHIVRRFHSHLKSANAIGRIPAARFTASRQVADNTFSIHQDLDVFMDMMRMPRSAEIHNWRDRWEVSRKRQRREMLRKLEDLPAFLSDGEDEHEREDALTYLHFELIKHRQVTRRVQFHTSCTPNPWLVQ